MVKNLKELAKLIQLCRKTGVSHIKLGDVELQLGATHTKVMKTKALLPELDPGSIPRPFMAPETYGDQASIDSIEVDRQNPPALEGDDLLYYSVGGAQ